MSKTALCKHSYDFQQLINVIVKGSNRLKNSNQNQLILPASKHFSACLLRDHPSELNGALMAFSFMLCASATYVDNVDLR